MSFHAPTLEEHLARYGFALWFIKRRRVLDVGCNNGYGDVQLSWGAQSITGYDNDEKMLEKARSRQYECPAEFKRVDFNTDEFLGDGFDVVVCFETLEHVDDPDALMRKIAGALVPGGTFVFSVPHLIANRQHKTLFDKQAITDLIGRHLTLKELHVFDERPVTKRHCWARVVDYVGFAQKV